MAPSSSDVDSAGFANKSPNTMPRENEFFACSLDSFSKTAAKCPSMAPVTTLSRNQR